MNPFKRTLAATVAATIIAVCVLVVRQGQIALLRAENQALVAEQENQRAVHQAYITPPPRGEPDRSPRMEDELSRLRAEVAQLTGEIEAAKAHARQHARYASNSALSVGDQRPSASSSSGSAGEGASTNDSLNFQYSADVRVTVPWSQTAVTGGWQLPSGDRAFVLATPTQGEDAAHLRIETQIVEVPQAAAERLGFGASSAQEREVQHSMVIAADQAEAVVKGPEEGVRVVAGTASAMIGVVTEIQLGAAGPVVNFMPMRNSADGSGIELQLTAKLNYPLTPVEVTPPPRSPGS